MVADELGFRQTLPQKRDSVVEDQIISTQTGSAKLEVPQFSISRSASPILEPMSARLTSPATGVHPAMDSLEDPPLFRMSARIAS
jgi:glucosamine-6-phosphate deaminase